MQSSNSDHHPSPHTLHTPHRKVDVILLTDNRDGNSQDQTTSKFKHSGFKETEIDPLQQRGRDIQWVSLIEDLSKRVSHLEEKVQELNHLAESEEGSSRIKTKKRRRCFNEMQRNFRCLQCSRVYGSETALKNHMKIKHTQIQPSQ